MLTLLSCVIADNNNILLLNDFHMVPTDWRDNMNVTQGKYECSWGRCNNLGNYDSDSPIELIEYVVQKAN